MGGIEAYHSFVIRCAGRGERMSPAPAVLSLRKDLYPKPLMQILPGQRILDIVIKGIQAAGCNSIVVPLYYDDNYPDFTEISRKIRAYCASRYPFIRFVSNYRPGAQPKGIGEYLLKNPAVKRIVLTHGDLPFVSAETWKKLLRCHNEAAADVSILFISVPNPRPNSTRILRYNKGNSLVGCFIEEETIAALIKNQQDLILEGKHYTATALSSLSDIPLGIMVVERELYLQLDNLDPLESNEQYGALLNSAIAKGAKIQMVELPVYAESRDFNNRTVIRQFQEEKNIQMLPPFDFKFDRPFMPTPMPLSHYELLEKVYGVSIYPLTKIFASQNILDFLSKVSASIDLADGVNNFCRTNNIRDLRNLPRKNASFKDDPDFFVGINTILSGTVWFNDKVVIYPGSYIGNSFLQDVRIGRNTALVGVWARESIIESSPEKPTIVQGKRIAQVEIAKGERGSASTGLLQSLRSIEWLR